ncbi:MAG: histidinol dehydrogenase [Euryarchaeota archaeon]|nr:histidinol dehydrogenase [Euryarchaeota archaeon]MDE1836748.1 histidinol dehydrogenase [Euryarchaeota archaeon]MDE1879766.1 histidinol dehydrogenase [Euryarchaeota archaeon]MDE2044732.1 histidinol dehydrogenase [Thermoplasmata archaeon]
MIAVRPLGPEALRSVEQERRDYRTTLESTLGRVRPVLDAVRREGDGAVRRFEQELDQWGGPLRVSREAWERADARTPTHVRKALSTALERIRAFHTAQHPPLVERRLPGGSLLTLRFRPLARVGTYAPGGRFPYPSTVLMTAVPAKVAGVAEVFLATPPRKGETDGLAPAIATAARLAEVDRIYLMGGAVAVGAFAYGTPSVPRVDKIVGPGNRYFTAAKREVAGEVGIDALAGPSESLLVVDRTAPFDLVVRETLAQVEHGADSRARVVVFGASLADSLARRLEAELTDPATAEQVEVWVARDLAEARRFAEAVAPESLFVCVEDLVSWERDPPPCGALFLGPWSSVAFGDYVTGTNHVLPVEGSARFASSLTTFEFGRWSSTQKLTKTDAEALAAPGAAIAEAEGLNAHAEAMRARTRPWAPNPAIAPSPPPSPAAGAAVGTPPPPRSRRRHG